MVIRGKTPVMETRKSDDSAENSQNQDQVNARIIIRETARRLLFQNEEMMDD